MSGYHKRPHATNIVDDMGLEGSEYYYCAAALIGIEVDEYDNLDVWAGVYMQRAIDADDGPWPAETTRHGAVVIALDDRNYPPDIAHVEGDIEYGGENCWVEQLAAAMETDAVGTYAIDCVSRSGNGTVRVEVSRHDSGPERGGFRRELCLTTTDGRDVSIVIPNNLAEDGAEQMRIVKSW